MTAVINQTIQPGKHAASRFFRCIIEGTATTNTVCESISADYEIIDGQEVQEPLSQEKLMFSTQYIAEQDEMTYDLLAFLKGDDSNATISINEAIKWD